MDNSANTDLLEEAIEAICTLRKDGVRVHSITNTVAQNFTANVLLACNARPSMTVNPKEVEDFTRRADCLHINLGTLDDARAEAIHKSITVASECGMPILLDPVMVHVSPFRAEFASKIMKNVNIVRGNKDEIDILDAYEYKSKCIVQTGQKDKITHKGTTISVENGSPVMANVIATGCAIGALISALSSKTENRAAASLAALVWFGIAGEIAAKETKGPGSFVPAFLDTLFNVSENTLREKARIS